MGDNTSIEWADRTWNPLLGCERVSPGCDSCYAINTATIRAGNPHPKVAAAFAGLTERRDGRMDWTGRINLLPERLTQPLTWRKPQKVFVNSQSDLFHKDVPMAFIHKVFAVMAATPQHTYQLLTKRPGRMRALLRDECRCGNGHQPGVHFKSAIEWVATPGNPKHVPGLQPGLFSKINWPLPNVWVGVSVEDQKRADLRIPALLQTPAAVRWISAEPLLGPLSLRGWIEHTPAEEGGYPAYLDWVVVGGESGSAARPMHPDWPRQIRDQCTAADVPYFFKQWGAYRPGGHPAQPATWIDHNGIRVHAGALGAVAVSRVSKKEAGRALDGQTWDQYPAVAESVPS